VVVAGDRSAAVSGLDALAAGEPAPNLVSGRAGEGGVGFVFSGQGAQRAGMGRGLYGAFPVFAHAFDEACDLLDRELAAELAAFDAASLRSVIHPDEDSAAAGIVDKTVFAQPGLFALEVALAELLGTFGVRPAAVAGHSVGELAAAHVAGVLSLEDGCRLVAARGRLMGALGDGGAMVALEASEAEAGELVAGLEDRVSVAAVNSPGSAVISGEQAAVEEIAERWREQSRRAKRLRLNHAFHSPLVEPMLAELGEVAATLEFRQPTLAWVSTVTGSIATEQAREPGYWVDQARRTVRFADAVGTIAAAGMTTVIELGPDGRLAALAQDTIAAAEQDGAEVWCAGALRPGRGEPGALLSALAEAWTHGAAVDWTPLFADRAQSLERPTYPFQHERYWPTPAQRPGGKAQAEALQLPAEDTAPSPTERVGGPDRAERERQLLSLVRAEAATVLGHAGPDAIDPQRSFNELGFESRHAVELRDGLQTATGLGLSSTFVFDHPTCVAVAAELAAELSGVGPAHDAVVRSAEVDEPLAIVGAGCRFPGGVSSPEGLWELVAEGRDAITGFPVDRGWEAL
ncbi:MAG: acyltransferase domain-containing protein, partial [Candidatus Rokuibacteriota bacterium]